ncbi:MAG: ketoacyl-ACP synthase III [Alphaproteobacteria bacterium]|nr:ketoacyl-ACP synthase III [Alphaproteobacteria bacterium]
MIGIHHISYACGSERKSSDQLATEQGFSSEFLKEKLGIHSRPIVAEDETTAVLAVRAARKLLQETGTPAQEIDALAVVTQTPDHLIPHVSALLHAALGFRKDVAAFDIGLGCSGFVYGLGLLLPAMSAHGWKKAILITADTYSRLIDPKDRATAPLFGDAAASSLLCDNPRFTVGRTTFGTAGDKHAALTALGTGAAPVERRPLFMDGREIFNFTMEQVLSDIRRCLEINQLASQDIDLWVFHQANRYILEAMGAALKIPLDRLVVDVAEFGNTTSSSIPIALARLDATRLRSARRILIAGFGVGLSWASTILTSYEGQAKQ